MTFPQGIDFRATSGFVTDPTNCTYEISSVSYPRTTPQGNTVGWEQSVSGTRDRSAYTGDAAKCAGIHYVLAPNTANYRVDLPSTGDYKFRVAAGDAEYPNDVKVELFDTTTSLGNLVGTHTPLGNQFYDATDTLRTSHTVWVNNNVLSSAKTFASTICRLRIGGAALLTGAYALAHVWVEAVPEAGTTVDCLVGGASAAGVPAALEAATTLTCSVATCLATGISARLDRTIDVGIASVSADGLQAAIQSANTINCLVGVGSATGQVVSVDRGTVCGVANAGASGLPVALDVSVQCLVAEVSATGVTAGLDGNVVINCSVANVSAAGQAGLIGNNITVSCSVGNAAAAAQTAAIEILHTVVAPAGAASAAGVSAIIGMATSIPCSVANSVANGVAAAIANAAGLTDSQKIDLILDILSNKQTLDDATGIYTLYADDGATVLYTASAWEDAAGTIPYRGRQLQRLDAMQ